MSSFCQAKKVFNFTAASLAALCQIIIPSQFEWSHSTCLNSVNCWLGDKAGCGWHMRYPRVVPLPHIHKHTVESAALAQGHLLKRKPGDWVIKLKKILFFNSFSAHESDLEFAVTVLWKSARDSYNVMSELTGDVSHIRLSFFSGKFAKWEHAHIMYQPSWFKRRRKRV